VDYDRPIRSGANFTKLSLGVNDPIYTMISASWLMILLILVCLIVFLLTTRSRSEGGGGTVRPYIDMSELRAIRSDKYNLIIVGVPRGVSKTIDDPHQRPFGIITRGLGGGIFSRPDLYFERPTDFAPPKKSAAYENDALNRLVESMEHHISSPGNALMGITSPHEIRGLTDFNGAKMGDEEYKNELLSVASADAFSPEGMFEYFLNPLIILENADKVAPTVSFRMFYDQLKARRVRSGHKQFPNWPNPTKEYHDLAPLIKQFRTYHVMLNADYVDLQFYYQFTLNNRFGIYVCRPYHARTVATILMGIWKNAQSMRWIPQIGDGKIPPSLPVVPLDDFMKWAKKGSPLVGPRPYSNIDRVSLYKIDRQLIATFDVKWGSTDYLLKFAKLLVQYKKPVVVLLEGDAPPKWHTMETNGMVVVSFTRAEYAPDLVTDVETGSESQSAILGMRFDAFCLGRIEAKPLGGLNGDMVWIIVRANSGFRILDGDANIPQPFFQSSPDDTGNTEFAVQSWLKFATESIPPPNEADDLPADLKIDKKMYEDSPPNDQITFSDPSSAQVILPPIVALQKSFVPKPASKSWW